MLLFTMQSDVLARGWLFCTTRIEYCHTGNASIISTADYTLATSPPILPTPPPPTTTLNQSQLAAMT